MLEAHQDRLIRSCEATYDELAPDYDRHLQHECGYRSPTRVARALADLYRPHRPRAAGSRARGSRALRSPLRFLDLGAGTGLVGEALLEQGFEPELVAIDVSSAMLERIECPLYVERHQADVLRPLPVAPASCDGAVAAGLMEYILDVPALFRRAALAMRPGGWFLFTFCPNDLGRVQAFDEETDLHGHDARMVEDCLESAGFRLHARAEFPAYVNGEQGWIRHRLLTAQRMDDPRDPAKP